VPKHARSGTEIVAKFAKPFVVVRTPLLLFGLQILVRLGVLVLTILLMAYTI
jgi:hypothetical protein